MRRNFSFKHTGFKSSGRKDYRDFFPYFGKVKYTFVFLILIAGSITDTCAQNLINENFESWENNTAFEEPEGWVTRNDLYPEFGVPFTVEKSTDASEGNYAAKLITSTFFDGTRTLIIPSAMVYGQDINAGRALKVFL